MSKTKTKRKKKRRKKEGKKQRIFGMMFMLPVDVLPLRLMRPWNVVAAATADAVAVIVAEWFDSIFITSITINNFLRIFSIRFWNFAFVFHKFLSNFCCFSMRFNEETKLKNCIWNDDGCSENVDKFKKKKKKNTIHIPFQNLLQILNETI